MRKISIAIPEKPAPKYPIIVGADLFNINSWLPKKKFCQLVIITDSHVKKLAGLRLQRALKKAGHDALLLFFSAGEKNKNSKTKEAIENAMLRHHCDRDCLILALGGGVVGDIAGYIAATYLRGVPFIQIPTTLLAMVDSSVGGKTGINTLQGKNLIGAIYQPIAVIVDTQLLNTLPIKHKINGLIEAFKMFLTHDKKSFYYLISHLEQIIKNNNNILLKNIIFRALKIKSHVVMRDEKELGERMLLNFGHTIGHALEKMSNYTLLHGYAVAFGILVEATIANHKNLLASEQLIVIKNTLKKLGIIGKNLRKYDIAKLILATQSDKKSRYNKAHYVLLKEIGSAHSVNNYYVHPVTDIIVKRAFNSIISE